MNNRKLMILLLFLTPLIMFGRNAPKDSSSLKTNWGLLFGISDNFTISNFNGAAIAAIYKFNASGSLRMGVTINGGVSNIDGTRNSTYFNPYLFGENKDETETKTFGLLFDVIYLHRLVVGKVDFYIGAGPQIGYDYGKYNASQKTVNSDTITSSIIVEKSFNQFTAGLTFNAGVEWKVTKNISLMGEYALEADYVRTKSSNPDKKYISGSPVLFSNYDESREQFSLNYKTVLFGVIIYF